MRATQEPGAKSISCLQRSRLPPGAGNIKFTNGSDPTAREQNLVLLSAPQVGTVPLLEMFFLHTRKKKGNEGESFFTGRPAESPGPSCVFPRPGGCLLACACWPVARQIPTLPLFCWAASGTEIEVLSRNFFLPSPLDI